MSLNYHYGDVVDHDTVCFDENDRMRGTTQSIIFGTIPVGINNLKDEATCKLFYQRWKAWLVVSGQLNYTDVTEEMVIAHMGLSTNASLRTEFAYKKFLGEQAMERAATAVRLERMKAEAGE